MTAEKFKAVFLGLKQRPWLAKDSPRKGGIQHYMRIINCVFRFLLGVNWFTAGAVAAHRRSQRISGLAKGSPLLHVHT